jgi:nuclear transport factor 2 (NTF2) superfamily protein
MTIPIRPPFTRETALAKVRAAEDAWNSRDPVRVSLAYSTDSTWRNRDQFVRGRDQIQEFLAGKWQRELDYRLVKDLWAFDERRIAVRFQYEWHNDSGQWFPSYGNELWEFDDDGLMRRREASINDVAIAEASVSSSGPLLAPDQRATPAFLTSSKPDFRSVSQDSMEVTNHEQPTKDGHRNRSFAGHRRGNRESVCRTRFQRRRQFPEGDPIHRGRGF